LKLAYIAGPYRANTPRGIVENIRKAEAVAIRYWKIGYAVICPHKNTALFDGLMPDAVWIEGDQEILSRCDVIVFCSGWEASHGCQLEMQLAQRLGKTIFFD
jgi:hypothetical protein